MAAPAVPGSTRPPGRVVIIMTILLLVLNMMIVTTQRPTQPSQWASEESRCQERASRTTAESRAPTSSKSCLALYLSRFLETCFGPPEVAALSKRVHICICVYIYIHTYIYIYIYIYMHIHTQLCVYIYIYIYSRHISLSLYIYIYT